MDNDFIQKRRNLELFSASQYRREVCCCNRCLGCRSTCRQSSTRRYRCKRRRHRHRRKLDVVLACRCRCAATRREGGSWLTQWETRPPGKYPLMPAKLPHSRTSLCPCSRGIFIPLTLPLPSTSCFFFLLFAIFQYTFLFLYPFSLLLAVFYTLCYTFLSLFFLFFLFSISLPLCSNLQIF